MQGVPASGFPMMNDRGSVFFWGNQAELFLKK